MKYNGYYEEPLQIFLSGSRSRGKSYLVKVIYNALLRTLLCNNKDPEKLRVLLLGPIRISVVNRGGTTIWFWN